MSESSACACTEPMRPGFYRKDIPETKTLWEVPDRYQDLSWLGSGAFSQVCKAEDRTTGMNVAIKKMSKPFQSTVHAKRAFREIRILRHMDHDNVIKLVDAFTPACCHMDCESVYLVTELQSCDLKAVIRNQRFQIKDDHIKCFIYQIIRGLKYIHSAGVIHRDLKPSNVVINTDNELKILDFGLARQTDATMTGYVATRWYRAPEVLFNWTHYTTSADIWSVGCIMAELQLRRALFPGQDVKDHFDKIIAVLGFPSPELRAKFTSKDTKLYIETLPRTEREDFKTLFPDTSDDFRDLLAKMLDLDPDSRISAEEGLAHPYLHDYADQEDEPMCVDPYDHKEEEEESREVDGVNGWRNIVFNEVTPSTPV